MKVSLVLLASARSDSNTLKAVKTLLPFKEFDLIDLREKNIVHFDYKNRPDDDFLSIAEAMTKADVLVFATPVYWYSMSGIMKVFFDRLTDLITTSKPLGRSLAGKEVYLVAKGSDPELPECFEEPFKKTCEYFNMKYVEAFYSCDKK